MARTETAPHPVLLGTFAIDRVLQKSRSAEVYLARDLKLRRPVCVKILRGRSDDAAERERLYNEARLASSLRSPYAIRVLYCDDLPAGVFFAMEWADGGSLADVVQAQGPFRAADVRRILAQAGDALMEAHAAGLVHRDIKPSNLLAFRASSGPDLVKLADFGIAAPVSTLRRPTAVVGTPAYLAPECWQGEGATPASDLYSLGATAYELWTGRRPFAGSLAELRTAHLCQAVLPPSRLGVDDDPALEAAILSCLAKAPVERPASVAVLLERLGGGAPGASVPAWTGGSRSIPVVAEGAGAGRAGAASVATETEHAGDRAVAATASAGTLSVPLRERSWVALACGLGEREGLQAFRAASARRGGVEVPWPTGQDPLELPMGAVVMAFGLPAGRSAGGAEPAEAPWSALRAAEAALDAAGDGALSVALHATRLTLDDALAPLAEVAEGRRLAALLGDAAGGARMSEAFHGWVEAHYRRELARGISRALDRREPGASGGESAWAPRGVPTGEGVMVGRGNELEELVAAAEQALAGGPGRFALLEGEAGLGKSRLVWEMGRALGAGTDGLRVVDVAAWPEERHDAYALARRLVAACFGLGSGWSRAEVEARMAAQLSEARVPTAALVARDLAQLLVPDASGGQKGGASDGGAGAAQAASAMERALREALEGLAGDAPLVLAVDDAHWADDASLNLLARAVRAALPARVFAVLAARPSDRSWPAEAELALTLRLRPLGDAGALRLCRSLLSRVPDAPREWLAQLAQASGGNPLFAEELVRWMVHARWIDAGEGGCTVRVPAGEGFPLSPTLESLLSARLDLLAPAERFAIRAAAVLGSGFPRAAIDFVLDAPQVTSELHAALDHLVALGLLQSQGAGSDATFSFAHRLHEEAAYRASMPEDRRRWHERAATWLEGVVEAAPSHERAALAARHWARAGAPEREAAAYLRAGDLARSSFVAEAAFRWYGLSRDALQRAHAPVEAQLDATWRRARAAEFLNRDEELRAEVEQARQLVATGELPALVAGMALARATYLEAIAEGRRGRPGQAARLAAEGLARLDGLPAERPSAELRLLRAHLGNWLGWSRLRLGEAAGAFDAYQAALAALGQRGFLRERSTLVSALALAMARLDADERDVAAAHVRAVGLKRRLAQQTGDEKPYGAALINYASHLVEKGRAEQAREPLLEAQAVAMRIKDLEMSAVVEFNLAEAALAQGESEVALRHLAEVERLARVHALDWLQGEVARLRGEVGRTVGAARVVSAAASAR